MWRVLLKLAILKLAGHRLHIFAHNVIDVTEHRATLITNDIASEWHRLLKSLIILMMLITAICMSVFISMMWLIAIAWNSPSRDLILGSTLTLPLVVAITLYFHLTHIWKKKAFLDTARNQINTDWELLKTTLKHPTHETNH